LQSWVQSWPKVECESGIYLKNIDECVVKHHYSCEIKLYLQWTTEDTTAEKIELDILLTPCLPTLFSAHIYYSVMTWKNSQPYYYVNPYCQMLNRDYLHNKYCSASVSSYLMQPWISILRATRYIITWVIISRGKHVRKLHATG
jgi:hypothetical protein